MYYLCSENKGADQLRGYREADLRLCFRICKTLVFALRGSNIAVITASKDNDAMANSVDPDQTAPLGKGGSRGTSSIFQDMGFAMAKLCRKVSCSRTQHGGGRFRTPDLSLQSLMLYH